MLPSEVSVTGVGNSQVVPVDLSLTTAVGVFVKVSGSVTFTVQYTADDVYAVGYDPDAVTSTWYPYDSGTSELVDGTANASGNFTAPPQGVRVVNTVGTGTTTMTVIQSGLSS